MASKPITGNSCSTAMSAMVYIEDKTFFEECLAKLTRKVMCDYLYIFHKGENGDKDHIHLLLRPLSKGFSNVQNIRNYFFIEGEEKTRCTNFVQSKSLGDWYNYAYHNKEYLDSKNETKQFYYTETDIIGSEELKQLCLEHYKYTLEVNNENELATVLQGIEEGLHDFEICQRLHLADVGDYVQALKLIEMCRKKKPLSVHRYELLSMLLAEYLLNNNTSYEIANKRVQSTLDCLLEKLAKIDLLDFLLLSKDN